MKQFQQIFWTALIAGACSGLVLFALQYFTVRPIIQEAEVYEARAEQQHDHVEDAQPVWAPTEGWPRVSLTALATVLTSIGYGALLFGLVSLWEAPMSALRGLRWGLGGFAIYVVAPALGLPPEPPGVAGADLQARQLWWLATALATAGGLMLLFAGKGGWLARFAGVAVLMLPHIIGAPSAARVQRVPDDLVRQFQIASIATNGVFWLLLGALGGCLSAHFNRRKNSIPA